MKHVTLFILFFIMQITGSSLAQNSKSVNLSQYVPKKEVQFKTTCYAYAVAYTALSAEYNIKNNIIDRKLIEANFFSPGVVASYHNSTLPLYKKSFNCGKYGTADISLDILKTVGTTLASDYDCDCKSYNKIQKQLNKSNATIYKIQDYKTLTVNNKYSIASVDWMRAALDSKHPVILGIYQNSRLYNVSTKEIADLIPDQKTLNDISESPNGISNHVVCIIGYDDNYLGNGGYFLIKNNFQGWGNGEGFSWIPYTFILPLVHEAYYITGII